MVPRKCLQTQQDWRKYEPTATVTAFIGSTQTQVRFKVKTIHSRDEKKGHKVPALTNKLCAVDTCRESSFLQCSEIGISTTLQDRSHDQRRTKIKWTPCFLFCFSFFVVVMPWCFCHFGFLFSFPVFSFFFSFFERKRTWSWVGR